MSKLIKNKNFIEFYPEENNNKHYTLNINTAEFIGLRGKTVVNIPKPFEKELKKIYCDAYDEIWQDKKRNNCSILLYYLGYYSYNITTMGILTKKEVLCCDKLDSMNINLTDILKKHHCFLGKTELEFISDNFNAFCKYIKQNDSWTFEKFYTYRTKELFYKNNNIPKDFMIDTRTIEALKNRSKEEIKIALYFLYREKLIELVKDENGNTFLGYGVFDLILSYFKYCNYLNISPKKGNFMRLYADTRAMYLQSKEKIDSNLLQKNQLKHETALSFSNEEFITIVPIKKQDFLNEAKKQSNCVYRLYLQRVIDNKTNVVFIRKKDDINKSFITCEVCNGRIIQFLKAYNKECEINSPENAFKKEFQTHLNKYWKTED